MLQINVNGLTRFAGYLGVVLYVGGLAAELTLPGFVQEAWASPSGPFLYIAWSNGGSSYNGSGVAPRHPEIDAAQHGGGAERLLRP